MQIAVRASGHYDNGNVVQEPGRHACGPPALQHRQSLAAPVFGIVAGEAGG